MGLLASCARAPDYETARDCIRVQQLNGFSYQFVVSVRVKDLLLRHPNHFICSSRGLQVCDPHPLHLKRSLGGAVFTFFCLSPHYKPKIGYLWLRN